MNVAVMGYGTVGSGVVELLNKNQKGIMNRAGGVPLEVKYILDLRDFPEDENQGKFVKDFEVIRQDDSVDIVVETMGGVTFAYEYVKACLMAGKHVVTSNKELVAEKGYELLQIGEDKNVNFLFEASVGGGIPIIRPISQCLAANEIEEIAGILNGTTNFILTKMIVDNMSFADALALAQELGYAERDPSADIEGHDACRKICILASLAFGKHMNPEQVYTQGITEITLEDVEYAASYGSAIKLIASAKRQSGDTITAMVSPALVKQDSQLYGVNGVFNAVLVRGDATGDVVFYGKGAGKLPTASAVVADVIDCAKHTKRKKIFGWSAGTPDYVADYREREFAFYIRAEGVDRKTVQSHFPDCQMLHYKNAKSGTLAFVTPVLPWGKVDQILDSAGISVLSKIPVTDY